MKTKRIIYLIIEITLVAVCVFFMLTNLTARGEQQAITPQAAATLRGAYSYNSTTIWMADYQKNLLGDQTQQLDLFNDGTYVFVNDIACIANMDTDIVTGAPYAPFYSSKITVTGQYETVSEPDELGSMEIKLKTAELKAVSGNFEIWPMENEGEYNFTITVPDIPVTIDTATQSIAEAISLYTMNSEPTV